jgi:hypothetical protein
MCFILNCININHANHIIYTLNNNLMYICFIHHPLQKRNIMVINIGTPEKKKGLFRFSKIILFCKSVI